MQKYKIVASKSQKKYTLIVSADSESQAREKLHKDGYSILSIGEFSWSPVEWKKFLFQVERDGELKNGVIIWKDIFKVYVKLRDELWYNIVFLYPEWDEAHTNAEKKQQLITKLNSWYELQKKKIKVRQENQNSEESFYMKKQLDETYILVNSAIKKFDNIFNNRKQFNISDTRFSKLEAIYEKLIHIKSSTNIVKLKEIWELALIKIGQIELKSLEENKNAQSRQLVSETNKLLKKIGSHSQFIEQDRDIKRKIKDFLVSLKKVFSLSEIKKELRQKREKKELIDTQSYSFLKTILLLEKYREKHKENTKQIQKNFLLFLNPFSTSKLKEKIILKRRVISQNISILKAKKSWVIWSYTGVKKWYTKLIENFFSFLDFISKILLAWIVTYFISFLWALTLQHVNVFELYINAWILIFMVLITTIFIILSISKNLFLLSLNVVFFSFIYIFSTVNF